MNLRHAAVNVSITSDLVCPWCWIGLRKLQQASRESGIATKVEWKPFMLRPKTPEEGAPKGGSPESRVGSRLREAGSSVGINFTGLTDRTPNTSLFHATIKHLQDELQLNAETVTAFHEAVFEGYFTLGVFPDHDGILKVAAKAKDHTIIDAIEKLYQDPKHLSELQKVVSQEALDASMKGVDGVPTFAFEGETAFSGAQSVSTFVGFLKKYASET